MVSNYRRKTNRASYSKESLQAAVRAVRNGSLSGYMAANEFKIPRMTIMDHVNNKRIKSNSLGRNTALSLEIEKKLASSLHLMEKHGFGLAKAEMLESVAEYVKRNQILTPFKDGKPGNSWFTAFKKRHNLSVKKPQAVEYSRKKAINPFIVFPYFELLEKTLKNLNLFEKPSAIWNMDATSFSKDPSKTKIVGLKGHAATRVISSPGKENTTVLLGANAQGDKLPPLIIYKGKHMWDAWVSPEAYPNTSYAATKNGWMESKVFEMYFKNTFLPNIGDERPVLLIYDGHATHVGLNIIEEARKANITILKLPAHTSHVLQPLDVAVMKSFKDLWDQLLVQWQRLNVGAALSKKEFARLIGLVWAQIDAKVLKNGFRKAGISPYNPKVVEDKLFDSLQLEHWKDLQTESQSSFNQVTPVSEDEMPSTKYDAKTLLSLALDCVTKQPVKKRLHCNAKYETSYGSISTTKYMSDANGENVVNNGKKIQILEDRIISFEELLLKKVKAGNNTKLKRHKMGAGAEVITHDDVLKRKMEENIKNIKKESKLKNRSKKAQKDNSMEPIPGSSGIKKKYAISKKDKGVDKSCVIEKHKTFKTGKKKRVRLASEECETSISDISISLYSDFDSEYCESEQEIYKNREEKAYDDAYDVNDNILVRYFIRKKWIYYIGFVEQIKSGDDDDEVYYAVRFYKTVKKPLKFILTKKIDRDDVTSMSVVKKITLILLN